jgi:DNA polymerase-3 subunit delta
MCGFWAGWLIYYVHIMDKKSNTWLFLGPEIGEKQAAIDEIRKELSGRELGTTTAQSAAEGDSPLEETVFYAGETTVPLIVSKIKNASLFADLRLFLIKCAEGIKKKEDVDLLASCLTSLPEDSAIILISEEQSIAKGLETAIPQRNKKIFWELLDNRKTEWVRDFFKREGFKISAEGIETILELVENNTAALKQECSRLTLFLDKDKEITGEDAEKWLSHTRDESVFTLFSRIAAGDFSRSLESLRMLLAAKETPTAIFVGYPGHAGLVSCFRKLLNYLTLKEAGVTDEWEYRKIGVSSPNAKRDYAAAARRYDSEGAESCLTLTAEYNMRLRSSFSFPEQILMDEYLYKIFSCAFKSPFPKMAHIP